MGAVFISHAGRDRAEARRVSAWLRKRGLGSIFLDFDPEHGIPAGRRWERELYARLEACIAVVVLCSAASMASKWCFHEIASARARRVPLFPVLLDDCTPIDLLRDVQIVDLTVEGEEGLQRLWRGMLAAGIDPARIFQPDLTRSPYPGLATFDQKDAAVFFGREGAIRDVRAELDRQSAPGAGRAVLILGASGSGKSSLMHAGIWPRLMRDRERWLPLPPFQPAGALGPLPRLAQAMNTAFETAGAAVAKHRFDALLRGEGQALVELAELLRHAAQRMDAQVLLGVDQAEQLLAPAPTPHSDAFLALLRSAVEQQGSALVLLATLRSDRLGAWQSHPALHGMDCASVTVGPLGPEGFRQVIQLPAEAYGLELEPGLVEAIVDDIGGNADALPILAFTLRELYELHECDNRRLSIDDYRKRLGGVAGLIERRAEALVPPHLTAGQLDLLRRWLVSLARPVEGGGYVGRSVPRAGVSPAIADLVARLIEARLLVSDREAAPDGGADQLEVVRVAHEALFRVWPRLRAWLADARQHHAAAERVEQAWSRWQEAGAPADDLLLRPGRELEEGRDLLVSGVVDVAPPLRSYVEASVAAHEAVLAERERHRVEAARQQERERTAREQARRQRRDRLALQSRLEVEEGDATLGLLLALEGLADPDDLADPSIARLEAALLRAILAQRERHILTAPAPLNGALLSPDEKHAVTLGRDGGAMLWDLATGRAIRTLRGHRGQLLAGVFAPDGGRLATASADHTARIFDVATGETVAILSGHEGAVLDVAWSADGSVLITTAADATARLWSPDGEARATRRGHRGAVVSVRFAPDGRRFLTASHDGTARLWDTATTGDSPIVLEAHRGPIHCARFSADGGRIATASSDGSARLWTAADGTCLATMEGRGGGIELALFAPDGKSVVTAGEDGAIGLWDGFDGTPLGTLSGHAGQVFDVGFVLEGRCLASCSDDGTVRLWDPVTGEALARMSGHFGAVWRQARSPSGRLLLTASEDATARLWDLAVGRPRAVLDGHGGEVYRAAWSSRGAIASAAQDGIARLWHVDGEPREQRLEAHQGAVWYLSWSPDGDALVTASKDGTAAVWNATTGTCRQILRGHEGWVAHAVFSAAGDLIATCGEDASAVLWDVRTGTEIRRFVGHRSFLRHVWFLPDGRRLATASDDGTARIWDVADGRQLAELGDHTAAVVALAVSPDGGTIATASLDRTAALYDAASGALRHRLSGHRNEVWHVAFAADGTRVVSASHDNRAMVWDVATGHLLCVLAGHRGRVVDAGFDPSGRLIATASWDRTARLWHAATGQHVATLTGHRGRLNSVAFSPDGRQLVTASADGSACLFELPVGPGDDWVAHGRSITPRPLSDAERQLHT